MTKPATRIVQAIQRRLHEVQLLNLLVQHPREAVRLAQMTGQTMANVLEQLQGLADAGLALQGVHGWEAAGDNEAPPINPLVVLRRMPNIDYEPVEAIAEWCDVTTEALVPLLESLHNQGFVSQNEHHRWSPSPKGWRVRSELEKGLSEAERRALNGDYSSDAHQRYATRVLQQRELLTAEHDAPQATAVGRAVYWLITEGTEPP